MGNYSTYSVSLQSSLCKVVTMKKLTIQELLEGYELGYITDIVTIRNRVYGKDPRGMAEEEKSFQVVWAEIP